MVEVVEVVVVLQSHPGSIVVVVEVQTGGLLLESSVMQLVVTHSPSVPQKLGIAQTHAAGAPEVVEEVVVVDEVPPTKTGQAQGFGVVVEEVVVVVVVVVVEVE